MNPSRLVPSRRAFLRTSALLSATVLLPHRTRAVTPAPTLGQGDFRYRQVPGWGVLGAETPVNNCHGLARDREGHILLLTDDTTNNVIVYNRQGKLVHKWGQQFPGAHGLSLVTEGDREVIYLTDLKTHTVTKTTLDGNVLQEWTWPEACGRYEKADQYRPSWTLHRATGEFFVLDGYGRDYIHQYTAEGAWTRTFGGPEGGIVHWGPHGGMLDTGPRGEECSTSSSGWCRTSAERPRTTRRTGGCSRCDRRAACSPTPTISWSIRMKASTSPNSAPGALIR